MAPTTAFEKAESDRNVIIARLDLLEGKVTAHPNTPLSDEEVGRYLTMADHTQRDIDENFRALQQSAPRGHDMVPYTAEYRIMMRKAVRVYSNLHGIKCAFPVPAIPVVPVATASTSHSIHLPPLRIPPFSGDPQEWISFRDLFTTAVHNTHLSNVEKLTQLKSLVTGKAAFQIRSIILSETNYDIAWKLLQDRYENKRELLFSLICRLFTQPSLHSATASAIRSLIDTTKECLRSLDVLSVPTDQWNAIILYLLFTKLDATSKELWEQTLPDTTIPDLSKMYEFLEQRARALAAGSSYHHRPSQPPQRHHEKPVQVHHADPWNQPECKMGCTTYHPLFKCVRFQKLSQEQRLAALNKHNMCVNCFSERHESQACHSHHSCKLCHQRHHTMVHAAIHRSPPPAPTHESIMSGHTNTTPKVQQGLLATALIHLLSANGKRHQYRAFLDPGSPVSFVTEAAARRLKSDLLPASIPINGLSSTLVGVAEHTTSIVLKPHFQSTTVSTINPLVIRKISNNIPSVKCDVGDWHHLKPLQLADPNFRNPAPVDVLIGGDLFWDLIEGGRVRGSEGHPIAVESTLGWLVAGRNSKPNPISSFITNIEVETLPTISHQQTQGKSFPDDPQHLSSYLPITCHRVHLHSHTGIPPGYQSATNTHPCYRLVHQLPPPTGQSSAGSTSTIPYTK